MNIQIEWAQQARQMDFLRASGMSHPWEGGSVRPPAAKVIGYGGAAGGGKSDGLLMLGIVAGLSIPGIKVGYFRRKYPDLEGPGGAIMRSKELMSGWASYNGSLRRWTFPTNSILQFCHCQYEADIYSYKSQQFDIILIDEATQFSRRMYRYLLTRNRATVPYPEGFTPFMALATNPGDVGHIWFRREFVKIGESDKVHEVEVEPGRFETHLFIPSKLSDNQVLERRDPAYRKNLENQDADTKRMLLDGDWDIFKGQFFSSWRDEIHVVKNVFEIPDHWNRFICMDYGLDMLAVYDDAVDGFGRIYAYREIYEPDLPIPQAAERIKEFMDAARTSTGERVKFKYIVGSPDLQNRRQDTGISGIELFAKHGVHGIIPADDRRVPGWRAFAEYIEPMPDEQGGKSPKFFVFPNCVNLIETLPALVRDENNPNDVANCDYDHGAEAQRYGIMSRVPRTVSEEEKRKRAAKRRDQMKPRRRITGT